MGVGHYIEFADRYFKEVFPGVLFGILSKDDHHLNVIHKHFDLSFMSDPREPVDALGIHIQNRSTKKTYHPLQLYKVLGHEKVTDFISANQQQTFASFEDGTQKLIYITLVSLSNLAPELVHGDFSRIAAANQ